MPDSDEAETALELKGREGAFEVSARLSFDTFERVRNGVLQFGESGGVAFYCGRFRGQLRVREDEAQNLFGGAVARRLRSQSFDERVNELKGFNFNEAERGTDGRVCALTKLAVFGCEYSFGVEHR